MRILAMVAAAVLLPSLAFAHGPLPEVTALSGEPPGVVRTTHGILRHDQDWRWICPEVFAPAISANPFLLPGGRLLVATTQGIRWTDDGCNWAWAEGVDSYIAHIERDEQGTLWGLTQSALMRSVDDGLQWQVADTIRAGASLRAFVRGPERWAIAGWAAGSTAVIWLGAPGEAWIEAEVPFEVGQLMEPVGVGPQGQAWFNYPVQGIGTVLRVSDAGVVELVVESIGDVAGLVVEDGVPLLGTRDAGLLRSEDDGATWTTVDDAGLNCLGRGDSSWIGCFDALAGVGAVARWDGEGWQALLELDDIAGPMDCPSPSEDATEACAEEWQAVQEALLLASQAAQPQVPESGATPPQQQSSGCSYSAHSGGVYWLLLFACMARWRCRAQSR